MTSKPGHTTECWLGSSALDSILELLCVILELFKKLFLRNYFALLRIFIIISLEITYHAVVTFLVLIHIICALQYKTEISVMQ